jgi:pimeloyl-ACP methyl ester carboxylesterase
MGAEKRVHAILAAMLVTAFTLFMPVPPAHASPVSPRAAARPNISIGAPGDAATRTVRAARAARAGDAHPAPRPASAGTAMATSGVDGGTVTPVGTGDADAYRIAAAAVSDGSLSGAAYLTTPPAYGVNGLAAGLAGFPTSGSDAALLTTGDATLAPTANQFQSSGRNAGGAATRGGTAYDVTVLQLTLDAPVGTTCLSLDFRYLTEEFAEFVGSAYNDGFIAELDRTTWTTSGSTILAPDNFALDTHGDVISTNTSGADAMSASSAAGTTYDGATQLLRASTMAGPGRHTLYLSIFDQYDAVYDSAALIDNVHFGQGQCSSGTAPARLPLIFLPGIMGSQLVTGDGDEAWPRAIQTLISSNDEHLDQLQLKDDGYTNCDGCDIYVGEVLRKILTVDVYDTTINLIRKAGYTFDDDGIPEPGENFFLFPFDWRRSAASNAEVLLQYIDYVRAATGSPRVNLLAHSQGGLVAEALTSSPASVGRVNRVVTLGTPYFGAAKATGSLQYKEPCESEAFGFCVLDNDEVAKLARNFPGMLELLPSAPYYQYVGSPIYRMYDADGDGIIDGALNPSQVRAVLSDQNLALIDQASQWHQSVDSWHPADPQLGLTRIVGTGLNSIASVIDERVMKCTGYLWWRKCQLVPHVSFGYVTGDGTVPRGSAAPPASLAGGAPTYYVGGVGHGDLPKKDYVLATALSVLAGQGPTGPRDIQGGVAVSEEPTPLSGTEVAVTGAATGLFTDPDGNRTGVVDTSTGQALRDIPGSTYNAGADFSSTFLTAGSATGQWTATEDGEIRVTVRGYADEVPATTVPYPIVTVPAGAVLHLGSVGIPLGTPPVLTVDDNADGTVDRTVSALPAVNGSAAADIIAPTSSATVQHYVAADGSHRARVTVTATDTGGAGVDRIEWAYDPDATTGTYTGTLDLPDTGTVYLRAIDKAGNVQAPYTTVTLGA